MDVQTVVVELKVPKESKDVVDLLDGVLEKALAKSDFSEYSELLGKLMAALDGVQGVAPELASEYRDELAGYMVKVLMARLAPVAPKA